MLNYSIQTKPLHNLTCTAETRKNYRLKTRINDFAFLFDRLQMPISSKFIKKETISDLFCMREGT